MNYAIEREQIFLNILFSSIILKENWLNIKEMWVECYRERQLNLGEKTNNRIESLNCHLK